MKQNTERFKTIEGFENYEVSDLGRIRNKKFGNFLTKLVNRNGYNKVRLYNKGKWMDKYVHRLVMAAFIGKSDLEVNHRDLRKDNNKLSNLEYTSRAENMRHYWAHKRQSGLHSNALWDIKF